MKLLLFDIDQTLLQSSRGHRDAFAVGFKEAYGVDASLGDDDFSGMTDTQIIGVVLRKRGLSQKAIDADIDECVRSMEKAYADILKSDRLEILPGVSEMIRALGEKEGVFLGLVTGNLEPIAWGKLGKVGLAGYFKLGGFGNESVNRSDLVQNAIRKAERTLGFKGRGNVFVFGDTPLDIKAALQAKARGVGVATGQFTISQLLESGAEAALPDFTDVEKVFDIVGA